MVPGKTGGAYPAEQVVSISLDELRRRDYDAVCEKLMGVSGFNKVVVNAVCYDDVAVFVTAYLRAAARGKVFMFRGSAAVVKVLGAVSDQPLLRREDLMCADQRNGGIIVVAPMSANHNAAGNTAKGLPGDRIHLF